MNSVSTIVDRFSPERIFLLALRLQNLHPPLFIVGTPRSGTTIVYLHLANQFRFSYFSNISRIMSFLSVPSAILGRIFFKYEPTLSSDFGITKGAMAPSDGWRIFHRWFPRNGTRSLQDTPRLYELKNIVRIYEALFNAPFINKNNANSVRIRELFELFPDAIFIHVHRNPKQTALSLLDARRKHKIPINYWWGPPPPDLANSEFDSEEVQVVQQVIGLEKFIETSLASIPRDHKISVDYDDFCQNPGKLSELVANRYIHFGQSLEKNSYNLPEKYRAKSKASLFDKATVSAIERALEIVDG